MGRIIVTKFTGRVHGIALHFELTCMLWQNKFQKHSLNFTEINTLISDKSMCMQRPGFYYFSCKLRKLLPTKKHPPFDESSALFLPSHF